MQAVTQVIPYGEIAAVRLVSRMRAHMRLKSARLVEDFLATCPLASKIIFLVLMTAYVRIHRVQ